MGYWKMGRLVVMMKKILLILYIIPMIFFITGLVLRDIAIAQIGNVLMIPPSILLLIKILLEKRKKREVEKSKPNSQETPPNDTNPSP